MKTGHFRTLLVDRMMNKRQKASAAGRSLYSQRGKLAASDSPHARQREQRGGGRPGERPELSRGYENPAQADQYLNERKVNEVAWLEALGHSDVPATLIWGELDQIAPVAVADYVWEHTLKDRAAPARYWRIPCANHCLQLDHPELLADLVRSTIGGDPVSFETAQECQPIQIG